MKQETPLERLYRMLEQHLGRDLTADEKRMVSLSDTVGRNLEANQDLYLDPPPPKIASGE